MKKKIKEVAKFGGVDELGSVEMHGHTHEASSVEAKSEDTHLEDDHGVGEATVIRRFMFQMNMEHPEVFIERRPSKQDIFNSHVKGIEAMLWKDGLSLFVDIPPRITFDTKKFQYSIFVAARPQRGYILNERPQTLSEIANG